MGKFGNPCEAAYIHKEQSTPKLPADGQGAMGQSLGFQYRKRNDSGFDAIQMFYIGVGCGRYVPAILPGYR